MDINSRRLHFPLLLLCTKTCGKPQIRMGATGFVFSSNGRHPSYMSRRGFRHDIERHSNSLGQQRGMVMVVFMMMLANAIVADCGVDHAAAVCAASETCTAIWSSGTGFSTRYEIAMINTGVDAALCVTNATDNFLLTLLQAWSFCGAGEEWDTSLKSCICRTTGCALSCGYDVTTDTVALIVFTALLILLVAIQLYSIPRYIQSMKKPNVLGGASLR